MTTVRGAFTFGEDPHAEQRRQTKGTYLLREPRSVLLLLLQGQGQGQEGEEEVQWEPAPQLLHGPASYRDHYLYTCWAPRSGVERRHMRRKAEPVLVLWGTPALTDDRRQITFAMGIAAGGGEEEGEEEVDVTQAVVKVDEYGRAYTRPRRDSTHEAPQRPGRR